GAVHGLASPIGGRFSAPHGAVCAALLPHVLAANLAALRSRAGEDPVLERFDEVARLITGDARAMAEDGLVWCDRITGQLRIPRLRHWGVTEADAEDLARKSTDASSMK